MNRKSMLIYLFISIIVLQVIYFNSLPIARCKNEIPPQYYQNLDLNTTYVYNVSQFDSVLHWYGLDWTYKGDAISNPGGKIIVNFTDFFPKDVANDYSCFDGPIPHINITFIVNQSNLLVKNTTLYNISVTEAGMALAISYNSFLSGFLIPIDDFDTLAQKAYDQDSGFMEGDIQVNEYDYIIEFIFKQDTKAQNSTMIYDKTTGLLVYSKVENLYGPDIEINLSGYEMNFQKTNETDNDDNDKSDNGNDLEIISIIAYPHYIIFAIITVSIIVIILRIKKYKI
ncbi:MAG: hypothetical protein ACTSQJ_12840 [Promethearchaeota archaeon]